MAREDDEGYETDNYELEDEDQDLYAEEGREGAMEDDEVDELEEGFMQGYEAGDKMAKCALCKKPIGKDFVEEEIGNEKYRFCSEDHAEAYIKKRTEES